MIGSLCIGLLVEWYAAKATHRDLIIVIINSIAIVFLTTSAAMQLANHVNALTIAVTIVERNKKWVGFGYLTGIEDKYTILANKQKIRSDGANNHLQTI